MPDNRLTDARGSERFTVRNLDHVYAVVERSGPATLLAEPLDISEGGIKLAIEAPLVFQEPISVTLGCVEGPFRMIVSCSVMWLRQDSCGEWLVGCQFVPKLPREVLEEMFTSGVIERRQFQRRSVQGHAIAKWNLQPELFGAWLVDISEAGFCIRCIQPGQVGQGIRLTFDTANGTTQVEGKAQWCTAIDSDFLVGCTFIDQESYLALRAALDLIAAEALP